MLRHSYMTGIMYRARRHLFLF